MKLIYMIIGAISLVLIGGAVSAVYYEVNENIGRIAIDGELTPEVKNYILVNYIGVIDIYDINGYTQIDVDKSSPDLIELIIFTDNINKLISEKKMRDGLVGTILEGLDKCKKAQDGTWVTPSIINNLGTYEEIWTTNPLCQTILPTIATGGNPV